MIERHNDAQNTRRAFAIRHHRKGSSLIALSLAAFVSISATTQSAHAFLLTTFSLATAYSSLVNELNQSLSAINSSITSTTSNSDFFSLTDPNTGSSYWDNTSTTATDTTSTPTNAVELADEGQLANDRNILMQDDAVHAIKAGAEASISTSATLMTSGSDSNGINSGDKADITVDNQGSIITRGQNSAAILTGSGSKLDIRGSILTYGAAAAGIDAGNDATISHEARIMTKGDDAPALRLGHRADVSNSGALGTEGANADVIAAGDDLHVENRGRLLAAGSGSAAIRAGNGADIVNHGEMNTDMESTIIAGHGLRLENRGRMVALGEAASAVQAQDDAVIVNSGEMHAAGSAIRAAHRAYIENAGAINGGDAQAAAIELSGDGAKVINSGVISAADAASGHAIRFGGADNRLELRDNGRIVGRVDAGGGTHIHFGKGASHVLQVDNFDKASFSADQDSLLFVDARRGEAAAIAADKARAAAFDGVELNAGALVDGASRALHGVLDGGEGVMVTAASGNGELFDVVPAADMPRAGLGLAVFSNGFASWRRMREVGSLADGSSTTFGGLMGIKAYLENGLQLGVFGGGATASSSLAEERAYSYFGGAFARWEGAGWNITGTTTVGRISSTTSTMTIAYNTAAGGQEVLSGEVGGGTFVSGELSVRRDVPLRGGWGVAPEASGRFTHTSVDGGTLQGASHSLTVGEHSTRLLEGRAQVAAFYRTPVLRTDMYAGVQASHYDNGDGAAITFLGQQASSLLSGGEGTHITAFVGGNAKIDLNAFSTLSFGAEAHMDKLGLAAVRGKVGLRFRF